jgi:hypothetical protein
VTVVEQIRGVTPPPSESESYSDAEGQPGRVELPSGEPYPVTFSGTRCLEMELGEPGKNPRCYLIDGDKCPQLAL